MAGQPSISLTMEGMAEQLDGKSIEVRFRRVPDEDFPGKPAIDCEIAVSGQGLDTVDGTLVDEVADAVMCLLTAQWLRDAAPEQPLDVRLRVSLVSSS